MVPAKKFRNFFLSSGFISSPPNGSARPSQDTPEWFILKLLAWIATLLRSAGEVWFDSEKFDCFYLSPFLNFKTSIFKNFEELEGSLNRA